jgi:hypothetical protein
MKIYVIDKDTGQKVHEYEADAPEQHKFGGRWGDSAHCDHVPASSDAPKKPAKKKAKKSDSSSS